MIAVPLAAAFPFGYLRYEPKIPNGDVLGCDTCHKKSDFKKDLYNNDNKWDEGSTAIDSDADGFANGIELLDPKGPWRGGNADPTIEGREVTNHSDDKSFRFAKAVEEVDEEVEEAEAASAGTGEEIEPSPKRRRSNVKAGRKVGLFRRYVPLT